MASFRERLHKRYKSYQTQQEINREKKIKRLQEKDEMNESEARLQALRDDQKKRLRELKMRTSRRKYKIKYGKRIIEV